MRFVRGVWGVVERDGDYTDGMGRNARAALRGSGCGVKRHPLAKDGDADASGLVALVAHGDTHLAYAGEVPSLRVDRRQRNSRPLGRLEASRGKRQRLRRRAQRGDKKPYSKEDPPFLPLRRGGNGKPSQYRPGKPLVDFAVAWDSLIFAGGWLLKPIVTTTMPDETTSQR